MNHSLKGLLAVLVLGAAMWLGWKQYEATLTQGSRPSEAVQKLNELEKKGIPQLSLPDLEGRTVNLSDFTDKVVIVNFWASWCDPCIQEFPSLMNLIKHFKGDVILLAISGDNNEKDLRTFLKTFKAEHPAVKVVWDKELKIAAEFGTKVLPESYILGRGNKFVRKVAGIDTWDSPEAFEFFSQLLKQ